MKYRIDKHGHLNKEFINDTFRVLYCPFAAVKGTYCGDACPLFSEHRDDDGFTTIELCHAKRIFLRKGELIDERER